MKNIYIGIDGGGSRLRLYLEDEQGNPLGVEEGGSANIRFSPEKTWDVILTTLHDALRKLGISFADQNIYYHGAFGLAGSEHQEALTQFLNYPHPFHRLTVTSDAHIACLSAHGNNNGAIIIVGTGIIAYQNENGVISRVGGFGFPHDDEGSGARLGLDAVQLTFKALDGRISHTLLTTEMSKQWKTSEDLLAHFHEASAKEFAALVPLIFSAAQACDSVAIAMIQKTCDVIYQLQKALIKKQSTTEPLPLALLGGLSKSLEPYLSEEFKRNLRVPQVTPEKAALLLLSPRT